MKTAISIPNRLFSAADRLARRLKISRSALYARAVGDFLEKRRTEGVTEKLNAVYAKRDSRLDPGVGEIQARSIPREDW